MTLEYLWETLRDVEDGRIKAKHAMETITLNAPSFNGGGYGVLGDGWMDARKDLPPKDKRVLLLFPNNIICSGKYRYGMYGEPNQASFILRCDCCGGYGTPATRRKRLWDRM